MKKLLVATAALSVLALPAFAQVVPADAGDDFTQGLIRPFAGLGHLFALIAVGLLAAQRGGRALWELPLVFLAAMVVGYVLALWGIPLPFVSLVLSASVIIFGLLIAFGTQLSLNNSLALVGLFGLFHGHAQGAIVAQSDAVSTGLGFALGATVLYAAGVILGVALLKAIAKAQAGKILGYTGWAIAAIGVILFFV